MKISIVVPVYNKAPYLEKCVCSIFEQTYKNIEIPLVDDSSTDGSSDLCDIQAGKYENVTVYHTEENKGVSETRKFWYRKIWRRLYTICRC